MKMKICKSAALIVFLLVGGSCLAQVPVEASQVSGLKSEVLVRRDHRSIPYIEGSNLQDLYFAQGYETARDRLWQMDLLRRVARGKVSELFGKAALAEDKRWRTFGFSGIAEEAVRQLSPNLRTALENYARGVNAYVAALDEKTLPVEFRILQYRPEPWTPADSIVIGRILADGLSTSWWQDINQLTLQKLPAEKFESITRVTTPADVVNFGKDHGRNIEKQVATAYDVVKVTAAVTEAVEEEKGIRERSLRRVGLYAERLAASNNWVISGKRTFDGKAILANDPHLPPSAPGIWYLTHLSAPGMRVSGVTFPGVPGIILGHNENIAWGATNVGPDVQDIVFEEFNDKGEYKTPDGWQKAKIRKETIKYRPNPLLAETADEIVEVLETRNGVVFREFEGKKAALKWTALNPSNQEFEAFISLNSAKDWKGFRDALRQYGGATQNFVYADTKGNIGWQVAGSIPIRRKGAGNQPYEGKTGEGDWIGTIPLDELPYLYNPPSGFIVTANQRIAGTDYKYKQVTRQIAGPWRARRIHDLLVANPKLSMNGVSDIQLDVFNIPLSGFAREVVKRKAGSAKVIEILSGWDGRMAANSGGADLANQINSCVGNEIASENPGVSGWQLRQFVLPFDIPANVKLWLPKEYKDWGALLTHCSEKAIPSSGNASDSYTGWNWGKRNRAVFLHPLAAAPLIGGRFKVEYENVGGNGQTPNVGASVSMRFIAKPADWDQTRHVIPLGQSGDTQSTHWNDQFEFWRTGNPAGFPFSEAAVKAAAKKVLRLTPEKRTASAGVKTRSLPE